ncbi:hypothetical protein [Piscirickettsia salmonis]|uniref:hypothetical protein n=1 Tax=Piscirickettsia salmonis TaxID=1238 RepID=UPI0007C8DF68|nr:hypothetical protein A0O36_00113 [Piscirickettsiaceae bacterium NZ-RLO1]
MLCTPWLAAHANTGGIFSKAEVLKTPGLKNFLLEKSTPYTAKLTETESPEEIDKLINEIYIEQFLPTIGNILTFFAKDKKFASWDELMALHRAVAEEDISLQTLINGKPLYGEINQEGIILNNVCNVHWQSIIPDKYTYSQAPGKPCAAHYQLLQTLTTDPHIDISTYFQELDQSPDLEKALTALHYAGINLSENWQSLKENPHLQKALTAAYGYLNLDCSNQSNTAHGEHGKNQTHQFIQHLMAREDKSLNGIRSEMQKWVKGYSFLSFPSNTNDQSRISFVSQSTLFIQHAVPFFQMSQDERKKEKEYILNFKTS